MRGLFLSALVVALAAGCGGSGEGADPIPPDTATESEAVLGAPETRRCENPEAGYAVEYPSDWHVNRGEVAQPCTLFDPEPIELPEATDDIQFAVAIGREPVPLETVAAASSSRDVSEREELEVAGNPTVRILFESTGDGLLPAGIRGYQYVVGVGPDSIVATTWDVGGFDFDRNREVLDAMVESLELTS